MWNYQDRPTLADVVKALLEIPNLYRIRFGSIESVEVSDELVELMATDKRVCPHLTLTITSGFRPCITIDETSLYITRV